MRTGPIARMTDSPTPEADFTVTLRADSIGPFGLFDIDVRDGRTFYDLTQRQAAQVMDDLRNAGLTRFTAIGFELS